MFAGARFRLIVLIFTVTFLPHTARAEESESRLKAKDLTTEAKEFNDVDLMIKNKQLRAASGSKSLWSLGSDFEYSGGNLRKPFAEDRPNIAGTTATTDKAVLGGKVNVKYNLAPMHSLSTGVGLRWISPLAKSRPKNYDGDRVDAANPFVTYQYLYNFAGMESVLQVQPVLYTESNLTRLGYVSSLLVNQDSVYEIGDSGVSLGFSVWGQYGYYDKNGSAGVPGSRNFVEDVRKAQADFIFGLAPVLEYVFNDTFNFRTVMNLWNFEHLRSRADFNTYAQDVVTQSMGLGISVTRDIFVYPNIQFVPENLRADRTNVGVSANVNVF